jgi:hypothetical protein
MRHNTRTRRVHCATGRGYQNQRKAGFTTPAAHPALKTVGNSRDNPDGLKQSPRLKIKRGFREQHWLSLDYENPNQHVIRTRRPPPPLKETYITTKAFGTALALTRRNLLG